MPLVSVDLSRELKPLEWYLDELILKGYINLIASLPGHGKTATFTGLAWQASRPQGGTFLGKAVNHGRTIIVDYDAPGDGRSVRFWLDKHRAAYPDGDISKIVVLEPDADTFGMNEGELAQLTNEAHRTRASLIIVDSFMAAFPGTDPNKLTAVQGPFWFLRRLATETASAVVLIDHLPKPMKGEIAGARGVIGSVAKPAQSRSVHLLTRVPSKEAQGRNILRWDVYKASFAAIPEPFGVELHFDLDALRIEETQLPDAHSETKTEQAVRAMQNLIEAKRGSVVHRKELLEVAIAEGDVKSRAAANALKALLLRLGNSLAVVKLPGPGQPLGYRLKDEEDGESNVTASKQQIGETASETEAGLVHTSLHHDTELQQKLGTVDDLRCRLDAGEFANVSGVFGGIGLTNLEPALKRILKNAERGDPESTAKLQRFMAGLPPHQPEVSHQQL